MDRMVGVLILVVIFGVVGCKPETTKSMPKFSVGAGSIIKPKVEVPFKYNPKNKEEFVFNILPPYLQEYGYERFCPDISDYVCYSNRLSYSKYFGKKGYFELTSPVDFRNGYEFHPVVLETGERFYYVFNKKYGGKYGKSSPIISLDGYDDSSLDAEPLVKGSDIMVVPLVSNQGEKNYVLDSGSVIKYEKLTLIREISRMYGKSPDLALALLDADIKKDEVEGIYFIRKEGYKFESGLISYIGIDANGHWLRFKVRFYGNKWLFVKSFKVAAGDYRWQSPRLNFKRDHSHGNVWEWVDVPMKEEYLSLLKKVVSTEESIIRFQGNQYYHDHEINSEQKKSIAWVLNLYGLIEK